MTRRELLQGKHVARFQQRTEHRWITGFKNSEQNKDLKGKKLSDEEGQALARQGEGMAQSSECHIT